MLLSLRIWSLPYSDDIDQLLHLHYFYRLSSLQVFTHYNHILWTILKFKKYNIVYIILWEIETQQTKPGCLWVYSSHTLGFLPPSFAAPSYYTYMWWRNIRKWWNMKGFAMRIRKYLPDKLQMQFQKQNQWENCYDWEKELQQQMIVVVQNSSMKMW